MLSDTLCCACPVCPVYPVLRCALMGLEWSVVLSPSPALFFFACFAPQMGIEYEKFYSTMAINETEFTGAIFVAATMEWSHGLYREGCSPVSTITRNVLRRFDDGPAGSAKLSSPAKL